MGLIMCDFLVFYLEHRSLAELELGQVGVELVGVGVVAMEERGMMGVVVVEELDMGLASIEMRRSCKMERCIEVVAIVDKTLAPMSS